MFRSRYPTPPDLAGAALGGVLRATGTVSATRGERGILHDAATLMVERHRGRVPDSLDALVALPGIGPQHGPAVPAFATSANVAVVGTISPGRWHGSPGDG